MPNWCEKCRLASGALWLHEIKHDGFRVIARKQKARVPPEIGPFACDASHSLGSFWSAIRDSLKGRFQVMHTKRQHWLDYDPVALAVLVIGMIGLLVLTI